MGPIGMQEMILVFVLALLLFGPKKLPELGRMLGKGLSEFRRAKSELKSTFETHLRELERETRIEDSSYSSINLLSSSSSSTTDSSSSYSYPYDEYGQYDGSSSSTPETTTHTEASPSAETEQPASGQDQHESQSTAVEEHSAPAFSPVADTVPRSNGAHPVESAVGVSAREDHPA